MEEQKIKNMEEFSAVSGISRPTISKYFNDPSSVRRSTRERIEEAIARYGYRPNLFAINQNRKFTKNIGIIVPHIVDPFYAEIVRQIETRCIEAGYWAIVLGSHGDAERELSAIEMLYSLRIAGAIIAPLGDTSVSDRIRRLAADIPTVIFDNHMNGDEIFVGTDNFQSVGLMVDYLCRSGEPPCFLDMPAVNTNARERREAYVRAMEEQGFQPHVIPAESAGWDFEELGYNAGLRLLPAHQLPTNTVLCANDRMAIGLIAAAFEKGLRVGRGAATALRVAGHDDHPMARFTAPALTTVAQDYVSIAENSVSTLFGMIENGVRPASPLRRLEGKLILRASA
ncbi:MULTISPECIES: LacI family DNA-binding transcriptional regulator [Paracoccus]|jgi:DNA-binding LacI/PurR family transcriptional regulator|uniref:Periplasmic binding protein/LacI transcriptional regulator n=1 Tax=Paracoccus denitrificans (strain Pd 1222) TaxID=318586 RepID=A1BBL2_PARDP|nr:MULTISPECIES: LacI family DNA-binding transcriptional regulator [Paracoccus]ABL72906.1 periplasmic binding protein/LacI transcriptional regulator [Paracoccus denitrificans PD1222]MBB4626385.1 DNA-binding LacI/PurR family transcriptional regulator [Paracoccus denitrificans]MCU7427410.1 LacI family transcriptional regulator [Paracoccus denitrificans]UPV98359.1 LacI family transcriptional regulator [Paracoccus denitrificans]WQO37048.1 LacI family DNA-binding transcriptional regulator [Paracocc